MYGGMKVTTASTHKANPPAFVSTHRRLLAAGILGIAAVVVATSLLVAREGTATPATDVTAQIPVESDVDRQWSVSAAAPPTTYYVTDSKEHADMLVALLVHGNAIDAFLSTNHPESIAIVAGDTQREALLQDLATVGADDARALVVDLTGARSSPAR